MGKVLALGRVVEAQETIEGMKARLQRLDRPNGIETDWVQIASPMAGPNAGFSFMPEIDDIAVIAYVGKRPIVLGFVYGGGMAPFSDAANERVITSRDGNSLMLIDGDKSGITLVDKHENKIVMDENGITISTSKDLQLEAKGTTTIIGKTVELNP